MAKKACNQSIVYITITFGATWLICLTAYITSVSSVLYPLSSDWMIRLGTAIPSATGLVLTYAYGGKRALKKLLYCLIDFKVSWVWWLYALFLFPLIHLCACAVLLLVGGSMPQAQFPVWFIPLAFFYILLLMGPLGEELGWRGFLLERFLYHWGTVKAGIIMGLVWSAWHIPLFFISGTIQNELTQIGLGLALLGYFVYTSCISLLITILYVSTGGNLLVCVIFHTLCNLSLGIVPLILTKIGATVLMSILILITVLVTKLLTAKKVDIYGK